MSSPDDSAKTADAAAGPPVLRRALDVSPPGRVILFLAVCCLGISALITQLTLMRELLSAFSGNELIFGIVLGNWLLLFGLGTALGRTAARLKQPLAVLIAAQILVAVLPIADVFLLRTLRNLVFVRGAEVGVTETVASCFVLLAPYCVIAGYLLTLACLILATRPGAREGGPAVRDEAPNKPGSPRPSPLAPRPFLEDPSSIGQVYFLDNIGDVLGGLLFSFVLIYLMNHFGILYFSALLNLLLACLVAVFVRRPILLSLAVGATLAVVGLIAACDLNDLSTRIQFDPQQVVYHGHSPYGSLVVTKSGRQLNFIASGVPLFSTESFKQAEETVHYAMAQRPDARQVLLISGGISGTLREILKYNVAEVDYVELDPLILEVARRYLPSILAERRIRVKNTDGRLFVKRTGRKYDVVIVDVPDPSTFQINRFYTREFFAEVKRVLKADGVLAFSLGRYENFLSPELGSLIAVAHRTLSSVYREVLILPGGEVFFLASDRELTPKVAERLRRAGIESRWMHDDYLRATLSDDRVADVRGALSPDAPVNKDFNPVLYYYGLRLWMSKFKVRFRALEGGLLFLLVLYLLRIRPVPLAMFTTGFAASALEVVLLVGFQILYGSVYHQVGVIVTMFMLGLGIGSFSINRILPRRTRKDLAKLELAIATFAALLPLVLIALGGLGGAAAAEVSRVVIPLLALLPAVMVGMEFPLAGKADFVELRSPRHNDRRWPRHSDFRSPGLDTVTSTAARLYTADFVGAALGALLVSTLLIPLLGVMTVCWLAAGLNLVSGAVILATSRT